MAFKILVTDYAWPSLDVERGVLDPIGAELVASPDGEEATLAGMASDVDAIMTCWARVTGRVLDAAPRCRAVVRYGVGVDNIDVAHATDLGMLVANVPAYCMDEVAEHALALLLTLARKVVVLSQAVQAGRWGLQPAHPMHRLRGQVLGIIGFGRIGRALAQKALGIGFRTIAYDPFPDTEAAARLGVELVPLETLLREADLVSIHVPLTPETHHLINAERLRLMKPTAAIVNTARGPLVDELAVAEAVRAGRLGGAGLDVLEQEPLPADRPLRGIDNLVITPHAAFYSEESLVELQRQAAEAARRILTGELPTSLVNPQVVDRYRARWLLG